MRVLILGATGRTGHRVVEEASMGGHRVTAVVRKPSIEETECVRVVVADPCNAEQLLAAMAGQDAIISCLGQRPGGDPWLVRNAAMATLDAMKRTGIRRYVIVSGALLYPSRNPFVLFVKRTMAGRLADTRAAENAICNSDTNWTIVRPPRLQDGIEKGYSLKTGAPQNLLWSLSFRALAKCLVALAEQESYVREVVGVGSR